MSVLLFPIVFWWTTLNIFLFISVHEIRLGLKFVNPRRQSLLTFFYSFLASAHVKLLKPSDYDATAHKIKEFFHNEGIHSTTIQIEYERFDEIDNRRGPCMVTCSLDSACDDMMCCKPEELNWKCSFDHVFMKQDFPVDLTRNTVDE